MVVDAGRSVEEEEQDEKGVEGERELLHCKEQPEHCGLEQKE